jgi:hypothetical protein
MRPPAAHAVDLAADRDNFKDSFGDSGVPATRSLAYT